MRDETRLPSGVTARREMMNTAIKTGVTTSFHQAAFVALLGLTVLFVAGHAQSAVLHDAAHDVRHATGFACH